MSWYILIYPCISFYILLYLVISCYILLHPVTNCYILLHPVTSYYVLLHQVISCYIVLHPLTFSYILLHSIFWQNGDSAATSYMNALKICIFLQRSNENSCLRIIGWASRVSFQNFMQHPPSLPIFFTSLLIFRTPSPSCLSITHIRSQISRNQTVSHESWDGTKQTARACV